MSGSPYVDPSLSTLYNVPAGLSICSRDTLLTLSLRCFSITLCSFVNLSTHLSISLCGCHCLAVSPSAHAPVIAAVFLLEYDRSLICPCGGPYNLAIVDYKKQE